MRSVVNAVEKAARQQEIYNTSISQASRRHIKTYLITVTGTLKNFQMEDTMPNAVI